MLTQRRKRERTAFTLIELLAVIAIVAILAALLLPVLSRGKAAAQSARCKSNLRQVGIALKLYAEEYQNYPLCSALDTAASAGFAFWDAKILPFAANNRDLFLCPADKAAARWTNNLSFPLRNPGYGYNMAGTGRYPSFGSSLGLDGGSNNRNGSTSRGLPENQVKAPSDMTAVADCKPMAGGGDHDLDDYFPINLLAELSPRHNRGENVVFCDDHVQYARHGAWLEKSHSARQRWNNDHDAHPETWGNNP